MIQTQFFMILAAALLSIGLYTTLSRSTALGALIGLELMLCSSSLSLAAFSRALPHLDGSIMTVFGTIAAISEILVIIAIIFVLCRKPSPTDNNEEKS